jgi:hypothetical protein
MAGPRRLSPPELVAKVTDIVGLHLAPPQNAVVLCVDEKSQIQALDRTAPRLPMQIGIPERQTDDYDMAPPRCSPHCRSPPASSPVSANRGIVSRSSWHSTRTSPAPVRIATCTW